LRRGAFVAGGIKAEQVAECLGWNLDRMDHGWLLRP
jgi:hypothetical protein